MEQINLSSAEVELSDFTDIGRVAVDPILGAGDIDVFAAADAVLDVAAQTGVASWAAGAELLYREYLGYIYTIASHFTHSGVFAEDLVQDVISTVSYKYDLSQVENIKSLLQVVTMHLGIDAVRRGNTRRKHAVIENSYTQGSVMEAPDDIHRRMMHADVRTIVETLPEQQRQAINLTYYGGYSDADAAIKMGISRGALNSHKFRGRQAIERAMRAQYPEDFDRH